MKTITAALAALALAACSGQTDPAQPYRDALPKAQAVQVGAPQDSAGTPGALSVAQQPLGDTASPQSEYATMSYHLARTVNGGARWVLDLLQFIVSFPSTTHTDTTATWGPWVDDDGLNRWQLVVTKQGTDYAYVLSAQNGVTDGAFLPILTGVATPGPDRDHGSGNFAIDFDAQAELAHGPLWHQKDFGQLAMTYDNVRTAAVTATFVGAHKDDGDTDPTNDHIIDAAYDFQAAFAGGQLQVAFDDLTSSEIVTLRTRWGGTGAGRSDAHYSGPDGAGGTVNYYASECWAGILLSFVEVYDSKFPSVPALSDESMCLPFVPAQYADLALPQ